MDAIRMRLDELLEAVAREELAVSTGEQRPARVGALYREAHEIFDLERLSDVQLALSGAAGDEGRRIRYLLAGLAEGRGSCAAAAELDEYMTWRGHAHLSVGERRLALGAAPGAMAGAADVDERRSIEAAWLEALDAQEPVLEGAFSAYRRAVEELGYGEFPSSVGVLTEVDLTGLAADAARFLDDTAGIYFELLDWHLPRVAGVERVDATAADALRLERAEQLDPVFSGLDPAPWAARLIGASGFDHRAGGRVRLHALPGGSRAAGRSVHLLRVPDEVVVLHGQRAGRTARAALLRGLGAGCHAAFTSPDLPMELRRLGDPAVPHAFGVLFESIIGSPAVLQRQLQVPRHEVGTHLRLAALLDLLATRAAAARLQFEIWWHSEPDSRERGDRYAAALTAATGLRHDPRAALAESVPPFRAAEELRARQLGEVLIAHLQHRCDEDWNRNPRTPPLLTELMGHGRSFSADELAVQLGAPLGFDALRARAETAAA